MSLANPVFLAIADDTVIRHTVSEQVLALIPALPQECGWNAQ